jgi:hypothetical protein
MLHVCSFRPLDMHGPVASPSSTVCRASAHNASDMDRRKMLYRNHLRPTSTSHQAILASLLFLPLEPQMSQCFSLLGKVTTEQKLVARWGHHSRFVRGHGVDSPKPLHLTASQSFASTATAAHHDAPFPTADATCDNVTTLSTISFSETQ